MKLVVIVGLMIALPTCVYADDNECNFNNESRVVWDQPRQIRTTKQIDIRSVKQGQVMSELVIELDTKNVELAEDITVPKPYNLTVNAGSFGQIWRGSDGDVICLANITGSYWTGKVSRRACLRDRDGDGKFDTLYGKALDKARKGKGESEVMLTSPASFRSGLQENRPEWHKLYLFGRRLKVKKMSGNNITIAYEAGGIVVFRFPIIIDHLYKTVETKKIDLTISSEVEIEGHRLVFDTSDMKSIKASVIGAFTIPSSLDCNDTVAKIGNIKIVTEKNF